MDVSLAKLHLHGFPHDVVVVPFGIDPVAPADPSGTHDIDLQIEATRPTIVLQKSPSHSQTLPRSNVRANLPKWGLGLCKKTVNTKLRKANKRGPFGSS